MKIFSLTFQREVGRLRGDPAAMRTNTEHMVATCDGQVELMDHSKAHGAVSRRQKEHQLKLKEEKVVRDSFQSEALSASTVNCCAVVT